MKPGKKFIIIAIICLICSLLGYETGRHRTPAKVITQTKTITVDHDVIHTVTEVKKQLVYVTQEAKDVHKVTVVDKKADGEVVTTTTTQDNSKTNTSTTEDKDKQQNKVEDHIVYKDREVTKTVINSVRPDWIVGARAGYNLGESNGPNLLSFTPVPNRVTVGAEVDKRIIGPIYGGVWFDSNKVGGVAVHIVF